MKNTHFQISSSVQSRWQTIQQVSIKLVQASASSSTSKRKKEEGKEDEKVGKG